MGMSKKDQKILEEVDYLRERYFTYDEPVPFCGLKIYPLTLRNYNEFLVTNACFLLNKNDDPEGVRLSHLDYLYNKLKDKNEGQIWSARFSRLVEIIFKIQNGLKCNKCGETISFEDLSKRYMQMKANGQLHTILECPNKLTHNCDGVLQEVIGFKKDDKDKNMLVIDGHEISSQDYMRLRKIVLYQNLPDFKDDSWVDREIREDQKARQELLSKDAGFASLEKKIVSVAAISSYKIDEIYDLTIRKFIMLLNTIDDAITYATNRIGAMSGFVKTKGPIEHWIYKKEKSMYGQAMDAQTFKNTITNA